MNGTENDLEYLVLDAGAIIRGHGLNLLKNSKKIVTVAEVIAEIRDSKARDLLNSLPYEIEERTPSYEAFKTVVEHAKKTGDFAALSKTDLKLIALTYMLEVEVSGPIEKSITAFKNDIRQHAKVSTQPESKAADNPAQSDAFFSGSGVELVSDDLAELSLSPSGNDDATSAVPAEEDRKENSECVVNNYEDSTATAASEETPQSESATSSAAPTEPKVFSWANVVRKPSTAPVKVFVRPTKTEIHPKFEPSAAVVVSAEDNAASGAAAPAVNSQTAHKQQSQSNIITRQSGLGSTVAESQRLATEDDGVGWVNVDNLASHMSYAGGQLGVRSTDHASATAPAGGNSSRKKKSKASQRAVRVACVTTDFSMQNVLMQMGLHIMSVDGLVIRSVKQWVLRCMACFQVHYEMDRLFCVKCGANHLSRVSASIDADTGVLKLHLRKNYQNDTRGTKYSLPAPGKQDRYSGELLLREDQLLSGIWRQKCVKIRKDIKSVFGEDVTADVGLHINKSQAIKIGLGQRNPNATKGRERRGKSKK